jgi:hypothetical protein
MAGRIFAGLCEVRLTNDERPRALHLLHNSLRSLRALFASVIAVGGALLEVAQREHLEQPQAHATRVLHCPRAVTEGHSEGRRGARDRTEQANKFRCAPSQNVGAICVLCRATHTSAGMAAPAQQQRLARLARHVSPQPTVAAEAHDFGDSVITPEMRKFWDQHGYVRRPAVPTVPLQCRPAVPTVPLPHSWACRHRRRWSCQTPRRRRTSRR